MPQLPIIIHVDPTAFHRFSVEAQAAGVSLEAHLASLSLAGFGVPLADLLANVFADASDNAKARQRTSIAA